jgi:hypothetical protein
MDPITEAFIAAMEQFDRQEGAPTVTFEKGQRKDDVPARISRSSWAKKVCCSVARRKKGTPVFRTERQRNEQTEPSVHELVRTTAMGNHSYVYGVDRDFGRFFLKFCTYRPYNAKLCLNGHDYVKQQLGKRGISYEALEQRHSLLPGFPARASVRRRLVGRNDRCDACGNGLVCHWRSRVRSGGAAH